MSTKEKVYACFVDFRKAFDSVWHEGLFYKLLMISIGGHFYNLIKTLYCSSTCSIRIGENKSRSFSYSRAVRQGCILRTFALIVSAHPYCARKSTCHVIHRARALNTELKNDRADGHFYSFAWI